MGNKRSAVVLLRAYLKHAAISQAQLADKLSAARGKPVRAASVNQWIRRTRVPCEETRALIESATGGAVPAESWA